LIDIDDERYGLNADYNAFKNDVNNELAEVEYVKSHVTPWNVDENVGAICSEFWSTDLKSSYSVSTGGAIATDSLTIPVINSGVVNLKIPFKFSKNGSTTKWNIDTTHIKIYVNDTLKQTIEFILPTGFIYEETIDIPLTVSKGDTISIVASVLCTGSGNSDYVELEIKNSGLYANIETVHKYLSLTENLDKPSTADILNALLGG
jgi:hypothetical protein